MIDSLELIEEKEETAPVSPILHLFCRKCEEILGECYAFCGERLRGGNIVRNPAPADKCVMCIEIRDTIEPGVCPQGHPMKGMLV
jgi:hypothetical protein